jgi:hypothetical protein
MKKPIIKAHANGWLPNDRTDCIDIHNIHIEKDLFYFNARLKINDYNDAPMFEDSEMNLYQLIFGTDFIDKLVGDGECCANESCDYYSKRKACHCDAVTAGYSDTGEFVANKTPVFYKFCDDGRIVVAVADYHRSKLANLKDIEAIKDYVEGLV